MSALIAELSNECLLLTTQASLCDSSAQAKNFRYQSYETSLFFSSLLLFTFVGSSSLFNYAKTSRDYKILVNQSRYFKLHKHISSWNWRMRKKFQIVLQKNALTLWRYLFITTLKSYTIIPNITIISNQYNKKSLFRLFSGSALHHRFRLGTLWMFFLCATPTLCNTKPDLNDPRFFFGSFILSFSASS